MEGASTKSAYLAGSTHTSGNSGYSTRSQESRRLPSSVPVGNLRFHICSSSSKRADPKPNGERLAQTACPAQPQARNPTWCAFTGMEDEDRSIGVGVGPATMIWRWTTTTLDLISHLSLLTCHKVRQPGQCSARPGSSCLGQHFSRESGPIATGMAASRWAGVPGHRLPDGSWKSHLQGQ